MYSYLTNTNSIHNNEIDESLDTKLEKLCNERKTLVESYNSDRGYHKFYYTWFLVEINRLEKNRPHNYLRPTVILLAKLVL